MTQFFMQVRRFPELTPRRLPRTCSSPTGPKMASRRLRGSMRLAIKELGLPIAARLLLGLAHLAWFSAAAWLLRGVLSGPYYWLALVFVAVLPGGYGAFGIFAYGEPFLTARIWAEPAALLAVACILRGRRIAAVVSLAFAAAMHPVMAFPAALFVFFFGLRVRQQLTCRLGWTRESGDPRCDGSSTVFQSDEDHGPHMARSLDRP